MKYKLCFWQTNELTLPMSARCIAIRHTISLDHDNGIENAVINRPLTPEEILEDKQVREQLYAAVMALPDKQAKRICARFYLGMTPTEIAKAEGVDVSRVRESIRRGLRHLAKLF
jgi:RNA polymerase sigma factor (sigma-70 family)